MRLIWKDGTVAMYKLPLPSLSLCRCVSDEVAASLPLKVTLSSGAGDCDVEVAPAGEGRLRCTYAAQRAGFYRLEVTCEGTQLAGSPFSVRVRLNNIIRQVSPPWWEQLICTSPSCL